MYSSYELETIEEILPWDGEDAISGELHHKIQIQHIDGPIFFGSITGFQRTMEQVPYNSEICIIRMRRVSFIDQSGIHAIEAAIENIQAHGTRVILTHLREQPLDQLHKSKIIPHLIKEEDIYPTFQKCITALQKEL